MKVSNRMTLASLTLAASTLVGIALSEGYVETAYPPIPGDVPTNGFGTTRRADGTPVVVGEMTTPTRALVALLNDATKYEKAVKRCVNAPLYPYEFSAYVSLAYNVGEGAFCNSSIPRKLNAEDYEGACKKILEFNKFRDCTKPKVYNESRKIWECPLVPVYGLTLRRQREYKECIGEGAQ